MMQLVPPPVLLQNDRQLTISAAGSRRAIHWPAQTLRWSELIERLKLPARSPESLQEYLRLTKGRQDDLKDVGGFVGGSLAAGRRKAGAVTGRDFVSLDFDAIPAMETETVLKRLDSLGIALVVYSTRKHEPARPRLRVLILLNRTVTADEYEPLARKLAGYIGIEMCDPTTFEASRLMYWPSVCAGAEYIFHYYDKPFVDADATLALYPDWRDMTAWPRVPSEQAHQERQVKRQEDPTGKQGLVGAFCRTYNVYQAMDTFMSGEYEPVDNIPGRYTFTGGNTTGGAVIYDNGLYLFSHHATDPAGGRLVNAFDLVRLHRFGNLDDDAKEGTPTVRLPSYTAMHQLALDDPPVSLLLQQERYESATQDFETPSAGVDDANWQTRLKLNPANGAPLKTADNVLLILQHDPLLKGKIALDTFAARGVALGALPWDDKEGRRDWSDADEAGLRWYVERVHNIKGRDIVSDALTLVAAQNSFDDVQAFLQGLRWDGVPRLDRLLVRYLGAEDSEYTRAVTRKSFTAAVARAMQPGVKFDWVLILVGGQGVGKSTLLRLMGKRWFSDSLLSFEGKEASELIQGVWINELAELDSLNRSELSTAKQFLSRVEDIYRMPYGKHTARYPRRCVFFGSTNEREFLRDPTGNRRFWPVAVRVQDPEKN
ncbi:MAG: virulence-associated E family protein, partial [Oscillospiraceae bacterium]|nr:virulence-associated E family protein [Oscillospiraceae bacterium]